MNYNNRSWIEIDLNNLEHNINIIKSLIDNKCEIMAVIKANAYGHGSVIIAKKLESIGINNLAVACLEEAIELRLNGISSNILILSYTNLDNAHELIKYNLIQTICDIEYAEKVKLLNLKSKLKCHIKIDTGMNRIGIDADNIDELMGIYENDSLEILGTYSHLCRADSDNKDDIDFTYNQINIFNKTINKLKNLRYDLGKIHLQSSYGLINYPEYKYDYVRIGILMYGINSEYSSYNKNKLDLKPVLSLKARITSIKNIKKGEGIGYGHSYIAKKDMKIATLAIGYADGISRILSNQKALIKVKGQLVDIVGRICMDQMMIDVSDVNNIKQDDVVNIIDNNVLDLAQKSNTISNEVLSRLSTRLERVAKQR